MVLLTMTPSIVEGLKSLPKKHEASQPDPSLEDPSVGKPIAHSQVVNLWHQLKNDKDSTPSSLENLLRGSRIYVAAPPPKPEPVRENYAGAANLNVILIVLQTPEYKRLMARLRREEEARSYERMTSSPQHLPSNYTESFYDRFPHASARAFAAVNQPISQDDTGDDDGVTYNDVHRQVMLIINFLVSIMGVAGVLWVAARWWSLPARLFLTMGGSLLVGVAEVAIYSIYVWRMGDAKQRQEAVGEVKEVVETWTTGENKKDDDEKAPVLLESKPDTDTVRKRATAAMKNVE